MKKAGVLISAFSILSLVTLTSQHTSKAHTSDNNIEYSTAQFTTQLGVETRKKKHPARR